MGIVEDMAKELEDAINGVLDEAKAAVENPDRAGTNGYYRVAVDKFENLQQAVSRLGSINVPRTIDTIRAFVEAEENFTGES